MAETAMSTVMLESAGYDVGAYFALVQRTDIHDSILGFHAQQGIEKALKAALFKHSVFVPKTHSLGHLLQALSDANVEAPPQCRLHRHTRSLRRTGALRGTRQQRTGPAQRGDMVEPCG